MHIHTHHVQSRTPVPEPTFTGEVLLSGYTRQPAPSRLVHAVVTFEPGSRTPWTTNPIGQTVVVIEGHGLAQSVDHDAVSLRPGDVVCFPPGRRHWQGAMPEQSLTCTVLQEESGDGVRFAEAVEEQDYLHAVAVLHPGRGHAPEGHPAT